MDKIVKKLSEIERTASEVARHAEQEKHSLEEEVQRRRDAFDSKLEAETQKKLDEIRSGLERQMDEVLRKQQADNEAAIAGIQKDFEEKHTQYAQAIVRRIVEAGLS